MGVVETVFEVGVRAPMKTVVCRDVEECKARNPVIELGRIYEIRARANRELDETRIPEVISAVRRRYPSICINYVRIDGRDIVVQVFDPAPQALAPITLIVVLALILGILVVGSFFLEKLTILVSTAGEEARKIARRYPWLIPVTAIALGAGIGVAVAVTTTLTRRR